jgi:hypothetical protein
MGSSSSEDEDRSTTGIFSEGPPCSNTGERARREDTSDGDLGSGGDSDNVDGGVLVSLGEGLPLQRESALAWCLSCPPSSGSREHERETPSKKKQRKGMRDGS